MFAAPFLDEKGLFLLYDGAADDWRPHRKLHKVDKTGLRPVILQSIHYVDPATGERKQPDGVGPIKFGFCGKVIAKIEHSCASVSEDETG
ncbi:hypothetical protein Mal64_19940 [Pseudobythopirellula maris]|uniref:Uncharacterized protein n=1 Tax=Pseudobythopirellula maris TaxID=2527991 RepID=A0A5C5ZP12_9BACT|nr:hypothetical protein [Pseudobythopirellula maris]TWT88511.1 hypothetical protein Mal64_19940 [Pseudobythopirellula maris]